MKYFNMLLLMFVFAMPLAGCDTNDGKAEEFGENIDDAFDNTKDGVEDAADDVGDSLEDACEEATGDNC